MTAAILGLTGPSVAATLRCGWPLAKVPTGRDGD